MPEHVSEPVRVTSTAQPPSLLANVRAPSGWGWSVVVAAWAAAGASASSSAAHAAATAFRRRRGAAGERPVDALCKVSTSIAPPAGGVSLSPSASSLRSAALSLRHALSTEYARNIDFSKSFFSTVDEGAVITDRIGEAAVKLPSSRRVRALLAIGPLVAVSWVGAYAAFTDSVDATSSFSTGTVAIEANDQSGTVAFTSLSMSSMTPGATTYASLKISNTGTASFDYVMTTATTGDAALASGLAIGIKVVGSSTCDATAYGASGTTAYAEATGLDSAAISARPLAAAASEYLCFKVSLPSGASNSLQGLTTNATFTFTATGT